jgi:sterol desaturase/sphingolipid hydroxylase (fatty acid hydroxylase superfamily)
MFADKLTSTLGLRGVLTADFSRAPSWSIGAIALIASALSVLLYDFLYYWFHRAQHAWPLLWRFHAVHHAIRDMNAANAYPHWTEEVARWPFITAPVLLLTPAGSPYLGWVGLFVIGHAYYVHSATSLHLGPLNSVICNNRFHRLHHSIQPEHFDRNFSVVTPLWDHLFGTALIPALDEWPDTGLTDYAEADGAVDYLIRPFLGPPTPQPTK